MSQHLLWIFGEKGFPWAKENIQCNKKLYKKKKKKKEISPNHIPFCFNHILFPLNQRLKSKLELEILQSYSKYISFY